MMRCPPPLLFRIGAALALVCPGAALAQGSSDPTAAAGDASATNLVEQVQTLQGLSKLSLEQLLDLPVVTASGKAEERSLAAANVFIVTRDDIQRHGYRSLGELLRRVPGMYLINDYVNYSVGVREVTGGYRGGTRIVKIMIDGFPISFRPDLEAFIGPEFIPMEAIQRVEIAKGPLSALYGANAFLATVNVITREPEDREVEVAQRYTAINGNPGMGTSAVVAHAGIDNSLLLAVSVDRFDRSGAQARRTFEYQDLDSPALLRPSDEDLSLPVSVFGRFDYHHDQAGDFRFEAGYQELDAKAEFQPGSLVTHRSRINIANEWLALHWNRKIGNLNLRAYVGGARGAPNDDYELFVTDVFTSSYQPRFDYMALNALAEASYEFGAWLEADLGFDAELRDEGVFYYRQTSYNESGRRPFQTRDLLDSDDARSHGYQQVGAYAQLHSAPFPALPDFRLTGAARADWIDFGEVTYTAQTSYRAAVAYRFSPLLTTKLIGGRAFQTPSGTLLYAHAGFGNDNNLIGTERLESPRALTPQEVTSLEFTAISQISDFLSLEASAFYQDLRNAIRFNRSGQLTIADNSGRVSTAGGELVANLHIDRFRPYAAVSATTQLSSELTRSNASTTSETDKPSAFPQLFGYAGCDVEVLRAKLFLNAELWWAASRLADQANYYENDGEPYDLPAYQVVDLALTTGGLPILDRELGTRFTLAVRNVLNEEFLEPGFGGVDIPQPGRTLLFELRQNL